MPFTIEFTGSYANQPIALIDADASGLSVSITADIEQTQAGESDVGIGSSTNTLTFGSELEGGEFSLQHPNINSNTPIAVGVNNVTPDLESVITGITRTSGSIGLIQELVAGDGSTQEVQYIPLPNALGGTFTLTSTTSYITCDYNISMADMQTQLNTMSDINSAGGVAVTGSDGGPWIVTWNNNGAHALLNYNDGVDLFGGGTPQSYTLTLSGVPTSGNLLILVEGGYLLNIDYTGSVVYFNGGGPYSSAQLCLNSIIWSGLVGLGVTPAGPFYITGSPSNGTTITFTGPPVTLGRTPFHIASNNYDVTVSDVWVDGAPGATGQQAVHSLALPGAFDGTWAVNSFSGIPWNIDTGTLTTWWAAQTATVFVTGSGVAGDPWIFTYSTFGPVSLPTINSDYLVGFTADYLQTQIGDGYFTVTNPSNGEYVLTSVNLGVGQTEITVGNVDMTAQANFIGPDYGQPQVVSEGVTPISGITATYTINISGIPFANYLVLLYNGSTEVNIHYNNVNLSGGSVQVELDDVGLGEWTYSGSPTTGGPLVFTGGQTSYGSNPWSIEFNYWSDVGVNITSTNWTDGQAGVVGVNEVMSLNLQSSTGGTFGLNGDDEDVSPLIYNIAIDDLQAVWQSATGKTVSISGSGTNYDPWQITYSEQAPEDVPTAVLSGLTVAGTISNDFVDGTTDYGVPCIQTISIGAPTMGTWSCTLDSNTATDLAYNISPFDLQTALINAFGIGTLTVSGDSPYTVNFGYDSPQDMMTVDASGLGIGCSVSVVQIQQGQS